MLLGWSSIPAILAFLAIKFLTRESARYDIYKGNLQRGFDTINKIA